MDKFFNDFMSGDFQVIIGDSISQINTFETTESLSISGLKERRQLFVPNHGAHHTRPSYDKKTFSSPVSQRTYEIYANAPEGGDI